MEILPVLILSAPLIVMLLTAILIWRKPYLWSSLVLALGLSSLAIIFYFIRAAGPTYGGADIGAGLVLFYSGLLAIPFALFGLYLGSRISLRKSIKAATVLVTIWIALSLAWNFSVKLREIEAKQRAEIDCATMPYHCAINNGRLQDLSRLKAQGYDIESKDGYGYTALIRFLSNHQAVRTLLELGANPHATGWEGREAIILALADRVPDFETADLLIEYGADINKGYSEPKHMTLLGHAISHKEKDLVIFLVNHGADPDIRDGYGHTACDRARIYQLNEIDQLNAICRK